MTDKRDAERDLEYLNDTNLEEDLHCLDRTDMLDIAKHYITRCQQAEQRIRELEDQIRTKDFEREGLEGKLEKAEARAREQGALINNVAKMLDAVVAGQPVSGVLNSLPECSASL